MSPHDLSLPLSFSADRFINAQRRALFEGTCRLQRHRRVTLVVRSRAARAAGWSGGWARLGGRRRRVWVSGLGEAVGRVRVRVLRACVRGRARARMRGRAARVRGRAVRARGCGRGGQLDECGNWIKDVLRRSAPLPSARNSGPCSTLTAP
jgi:hypothetical protein